MAHRLKAWSAANDYVFGDVRQWRGVRLVCCMNHTAARTASHPWAGARSRGSKVLDQWAPAGPEEADKLYEVSRDCPTDLQRVLQAAAGRRDTGLEAA